MNQTEQLPLAGRPRRRTWIDILLLQPLSTNPQMALVLTRRGRVFGVIPAGSTHVLSDYIDWPCDIIEVDGRERRLTLNIALESRDSGRFFHTTLQMIYLVVRPERVALEIDDALGELERTVVSAIQATARPLTIDQPAILKESIQELMQPQGSVALRIAALGLAVRRVDIAIEIAPADREFAERMQDYHRERSFACRIFVESLDPQIQFEAQVAGAYRYRSRALLNSGPDEAEFLIREIVTKAIRRVGIEFAPHEYREAAHAIAAALQTNPIMAAELSAAALELLHPVADIHPARPMLAVAMQARLLPAPPTHQADAFERILPAPAEQRALAMPVAEPQPVNSTRPSITHLQPVATADLWDDEETILAQPALAELPAPPTSETQPATQSNWRVESGLFTAAPLAEPELPSWLQSIDHEQDEDMGELAAQQLAAEALTEGPDDQDWSEEEAFEIEHDLDAEAAIPTAEPSTTNATNALVASPAASPEMAATDQAIATQISRWISLLRSDGDEEFERLALVIIEQPDRLPALLYGLIRDPAFLQGSNQPAYQRCLADELAQYVTVPSPPDWLAEAPADALSGSGDPDQRTLPEWLRVR